VRESAVGVLGVVHVRGMVGFGVQLSSLC